MLACLLQLAALPMLSATVIPRLTTPFMAAPGPACWTYRGLLDCPSRMWHRVAAAEGRLALAKVLLDMGADPCAACQLPSGKGTTTALHVAIETGHREAFEVKLQ